MNNGINHLSTGAGFLPSTVCLMIQGNWSSGFPELGQTWRQLNGGLAEGDSWLHGTRQKVYF